MAKDLNEIGAEEYLIDNLQTLSQIIRSRDIIGKVTQFQCLLDNLNIVANNDANMVEDIHVKS